MKTEKVSISQVKNNPNNPRVIKDFKYRKLVKSIKESPWMLQYRTIVVNDDMIVLGGNQRLRACKEAGMKEVYIQKASELSEEQQREFIIKDNLSSGEWDWDALANDFDADELESLGLDMPFMGDNMSNENEYAGADPNAELENFLNAEIKRLYLVYDSDLYEKVVDWFEKKVTDLGVEDFSQVILKIMEVEKG